MRAIAVQPETVDEWKHRLSWHFASFCRDGSITEEALWSDIAEKQRQLWVLEHGFAVQAAILTSVTLDEYKTCEVTHAAGENSVNWRHLFPALGHWAREIGCKRIRATCRPGWEPVLKAFEMKKTHVIMEGWL